MLILIGVVVGFFTGQLRWWWGLLILLLSALIVAGVATAVVVANPQDYPFNMSVKSFLLTAVKQLPLLGPGYAIGWGARWLVERRKAKQFADFAKGVTPAPMRVWKFIWLRPFVLAAVFSGVMVAISAGNSNAKGPLDWALRIGMIYLMFYVLLVGLAALQWRTAKPAPKVGTEHLKKSRE